MTLEELNCLATRGYAYLAQTSLADVYAQTATRRVLAQVQRMKPVVRVSSARGPKERDLRDSRDLARGPDYA